MSTHDDEHDGDTVYEDRVLDHKDFKRLLLRQSVSFFAFGLINNVLYVLILSAALDLVPPSTPKGIIAFCNIAPALVAKVAWPYFLKGRVRYVRRVAACCALSVVGMIVVAAYDSLSARLLGISLASFASGLGELTFLQLSTVYRPPSVAGRSVGYFASGTGAAGLVGAFMWWELRSLGVRTGVGISAILPFVIPLMYAFVLPRPAVYSTFSSDTDHSGGSSPASGYQPLAGRDHEDEEVEDEDSALPPEAGVLGRTKETTKTGLTQADKWRLARPLLVKYMLPLFCVYMFEYTINQGISPTLVFPVPGGTSSHPILGRVVHSIRDYYPLWQLVYQTTVFFSRSSLSIGLPPLPSQLISLPAIVQACILAVLGLESAFSIFGDNLEQYSFAVGAVFALICVEGVCGGLAYVNTFYHINQHTKPPKSDDPADIERARQEKEFEIGSIGLADSSGILVAALLAVPVEVGLCKIQVGRGRELCKGL